MAEAANSSAAADGEPGPARRMATARDLVVLSRARLEEVVDEAVARGRLSPEDGAELVAALLARARGHAGGLLAELEQRLATEPVQIARRVAGLGPRPPVAGYDDLTAAEVVRELDGMGEGDLRKVRAYERANANRKSVLGAVERKLG